MDELNPFIVSGHPIRENCTMNNAQCNGRDCKDCGFSAGEMERRKKLPLVKLDNGLYGKRVGRHKRSEG